MVREELRLQPVQQHAAPRPMALHEGLNLCRGALSARFRALSTSAVLSWIVQEM